MWSSVSTCVVTSPSSGRPASAVRKWRMAAHRTALSPVTHCLPTLALTNCSTTSCRKLWQRSRARTALHTTFLWRLQAGLPCRAPALNRSRAPSKSVARAAAPHGSVTGSGKPKMGSLR